MASKVSVESSPATDWETSDYRTGSPNVSRHQHQYQLANNTTLCQKTQVSLILTLSLSIYELRAAQGNISRFSALHQYAICKRTLTSLNHTQDSGCKPCLAAQPGLLCFTYQRRAKVYENQKCNTCVSSFILNKATALTVFVHQPE